MRLLIWNIWHGGSKKRNPALASAIREIDPDLAVLTEYRPGSSHALSSRLGDAGWPHVVASKALPNQNGVAVLSRTPLTPLSLAPPDGCENGWLHVRHEASDLDVLALYIPAGTDCRRAREAKETFWRHLLEAEALLRERPALLAGDFNTGQWGVDMDDTRVPCSRSFVELGRRGWLDAFRALHGDKREYSWWGRTAAFRIDHAFLSPVFAGRIDRVEYVTQTASARLVMPMESRVGGQGAEVLSDHAALVVELRT